LSRATILIVEDDTIPAMHIADSLTRLGYTVAGPLTSGEEALTFLANRQADLVIMDIDLAGSLNGIETAEALHGKYDAPIVFLTGFSHDSLLERAKIVGPYGYLIKPVAERELAATLEMALYRHSLDRQLKESRIALARSEARYRHIFENSPLGIFRTTLEGKALAVNAEMANIIGCATPDEAIANFTDLANQLYVDPGRRRQFIDLLGAEGVVQHFEYEARTKLGATIWISMNAKLTPVSGADGKAGESVIDGFAMDITKRKHAEDAVRESEILIRDVSANIPGAIYQFVRRADGTYAIPFMSDGAARLLGLPIATLQDTSRLFDNLHPDDLPRMWDSIRHSAATLSRWRQEFRVLLPTGEIRWMQGASQPTRLNDGSVCWNGVILDITEQKETEDALRQSEEKYRALVEGLPDIVMRFDRAGRHLFVSENIAEIIGLHPSQCIGKTHRQLGFLDSHCRQWEQAIDRAFDTGLAVEGESAFKGKDGPVVHNWRIFPEKNAIGGVKSVLAVSRDITAHRRAERNYQTLFREMLDGFALHEIICDDAGVPIDYRFVAINPAFEKMTGLKAADVIGRTVLEIMPDTERHWLETYGRVALTGEPAFFDNYSAALRKYFEVTAFRPAPDQFACIFIDITERKRAEEEMKILQSQLQQAQKMEAIGTLAGGIAHDFNNILSAILGYAEMAREDSPAGTPAVHNLDQVIKASNRARDLVKQILAFSRQAETARIHLHPAAIVNETVKLLRSSLPSTIAIELDLAPDPGVILADPTQIHQILMNLCTNAYHAMEDTGGTLSIALRRKLLTAEDLAGVPAVQPGDFFRLSISDTGPGIGAEIRDRIFDPYFTTKEIGKGTGMGLSIVHGIARSCGGYVSCHSQPGEGTVFHVFLPVLLQHPPPETKPIASIPVGNERILFIDDEKMLADLGRSTLQRLGYTVTVRTSSLEALTTFENQPDSFDLVITDQTMPGMTGIDLARRIQQLRPQLPIILCTGYSSLISEDQAKAMGIKGFALKPVTKKDIATLIRKVLDTDGQRP
jgi:PAS domain S-box-containing protein